MQKKDPDVAGPLRGAQPEGHLSVFFNMYIPVARTRKTERYQDFMAELDKIHDLLVAHSQKVLMAVHALKSASEAWQRGDREQLERLVEQTSDLEKEADSLRRSVARELSRSTLAHSKTELYRRLVHQTDDVADTAKQAGRFLLIIQDLLLPAELKSDLVKMTSLSQEAIGDAAEAIAHLSAPPERRFELVARISDLEETVDDIEFKMQQEASKLHLDNWSTVLFWRLIITVSSIADHVEDAADELLAYEGEL
jgi:predicted phosphate transport protein (TIGR00153 family)